jgi:site-specific recombinase XerD
VQPWLERLKEQLQRELALPTTRAVYLRRCREFLRHLERQGAYIEDARASHVSSFTQTKLTAYRKRHHRSPRNTHRWKVAVGSPVRRFLRLVHGYWPPDNRPDPSLERFQQHLTEQHFQPTGIPTKISVVRALLRFLRSRSIAVEAVTPEDITWYLESRLAEFQRKYKRLPRHIKLWCYQRTGPIRRYLRLVRGQWPPEKPIGDERAVFRRQLCTGYEGWLTDVRGLSHATLRKNGDAAKVFLEWLGKRCSRHSLHKLTVADFDAFLAWRNQGLRRATRCGVVHCLRSFLRFLYAERFTERDLAIAVSRPILYRYESVPSAFTEEQVRRLQDVTRNDPTPLGLRDYAMLLLVVTYGLRAGEVVRLQLEDIHWRREQLTIKQSKTGADLLLPLMPEVGQALLDYLRQGRPQAPWREVFLKATAPAGPFASGSSLYTVFSRRIRRAGLKTEGKRGPHAIRYARAMSLLRASVSLKSIGDVLGHRSVASTQVYLKLATEDLRSVALAVPGEAA